MRCLVMMLCISVLLGCASQATAVRCNAHLQPINVPAVAAQNKSAKSIVNSAANLTIAPKED